MNDIGHTTPSDFDDPAAHEKRLDDLIAESNDTEKRMRSLSHEIDKELVWKEGYRAGLAAAERTPPRYRELAPLQPAARSAKNDVRAANSGKSAATAGRPYGAVRQAIKAALQAQGAASMSIAELAGQTGHPVTAISGCLTRLVKAKAIVRVGTGLYAMPSLTPGPMEWREEVPSNDEGSLPGGIDDAGHYR